MADWVVEQYRFEQAHLARRAGAERRRVKLRWWAAPARRTEVTDVVVRMLSPRLARRATGPVSVALYDAADAVGARPFLVMQVDAASLGDPRGRATGTLVGRAEPGGVLVVETSRGALTPLTPPALPDDEAPGWSEVDPVD